MHQRLGCLSNKTVQKLVKDTSKTLRIKKEPNTGIDERLSSMLDTDISSFTQDSLVADTCENSELRGNGFEGPVPHSDQTTDTSVPEFLDLDTLINSLEDNKANVNLDQFL